MAFRYQPGNGGLAGAGVAREDHVHRKAGSFEPGGGAALLHLQVVGQTEHIFLDRGKAHQLVDLGADGIQRAGVGGRQQVEQGLVCAVVQAEQHPFRVTVPVRVSSVRRQYSLRARKMRSVHAERPAAPFCVVHWAAT